MRYSITKLQTDVMARLGEIARPQGSSDAVGVPWPEDVVALRASASLAESGSRLLKEASAEALGMTATAPTDCDVAMRKMPCGLYGGEVRLPEGFIRMVSVKMAGWRRSVGALIIPGTPDWGCQWSAEAGIAGSPERPRAYLDRDGEGMLLRLMGSASADDEPEWIGIVSVPEADENGEFEFPEPLYPRLVGTIAEHLQGL